MSAMASQITSLTIVYSIVYSGTDRRKRQSSASPAFVWETHWWTVNSPHKRPVTRKMFPFDDVIIYIALTSYFLKILPLSTLLGQRLININAFINIIHRNELLCVDKAMINWSYKGVHVKLVSALKFSIIAYPPTSFQVLKCYLQFCRMFFHMTALWTLDIWW